LRIRRGQDEFDVCWRLFQRFQHGIESGARQHVHFVDDVDLEATDGRGVLGILQQLTHAVDLCVGGRIDLQQVDEAAAVDVDASGTLPAWHGGDAGFTIKGFGEDARQCGLADAACTGEQISVMQALLFERVAQGADHMFLAD